MMYYLVGYVIDDDGFTGFPENRGEVNKLLSSKMKAKPLANKYCIGNVM